MEKEFARKWFAGLRKVELSDDQHDITFPMIVMYPTDTPEKTDRLGPYSLDIARDAVPQGWQLSFGDPFSRQRWHASRLPDACPSSGAQRICCWDARASI